jgi:hypothetical protein
LTDLGVRSRPDADEDEASVTLLVPITWPGHFDIAIILRDPKGGELDRDTVGPLEIENPLNSYTVARADRRLCDSGCSRSG